MIRYDIAALLMHIIYFLNCFWMEVQLRGYLSKLVPPRMMAGL